jgi:hypothetical protein
MPTGRSPGDGLCLIGSAGAAARERQRTRSCPRAHTPSAAAEEILVVRVIPSKGAGSGLSGLAVPVPGWNPDPPMGGGLCQNNYP